MKKATRQGNNFSQNIIDYLLTFEPEQTWTIPTGTGTATRSDETAYTGEYCLKIENTDPTQDIIATNSVQSTIIETNGSYEFSLYLRKDDADEPYSGEIEIYKGVSLLDTQPFTLGSDGTDAENPDENDYWVRFVADTKYDFLKSDEITIRIKLDGIAGYAGVSTALYVDGIMLNLAERADSFPPVYNIPVFNKTLSTSDVVLEDLIVDTFGLSALSTAPSSASDTGTLGEVRIDADYIYVCTATDTWKRVAIATW